MVKFKKMLAERLKGKIPNEFLEFLPSGFQTIGHAAILNLKPEIRPYADKIAEEIMDIYPYIKGVWLRKGRITGKFRQPEGLVHIAGTDKSEVIHRENGVAYKFDFTKIMFAKGNITERAYLPRLVGKGEVIVDMFAGIGYFTLQIAKHAEPGVVYAIELNPTAFNYLKENISLNRLENKIIPIHGDCKEKVPELAARGIKADRIIMGVFPAPFEYLPAAFTVVKKIPIGVRTDISAFLEKQIGTVRFNVYDKIGPIENTIIHFEGVTRGRDIMQLYGKFSEIAASENLETALLGYRFVKSYGPKKWHLVLDIAVGSAQIYNSLSEGSDICREL